MKPPERAVVLLYQRALHRTVAYQILAMSLETEYSIVNGVPRMSWTVSDDELIEGSALILDPRDHPELREPGEVFSDDSDADQYSQFDGSDVDDEDSGDSASVVSISSLELPEAEQPMDIDATLPVDQPSENEDPNRPARLGVLDVLTQQQPPAPMPDAGRRARERSLRLARACDQLAATVRLGRPLYDFMEPIPVSPDSQELYDELFHHTDDSEPATQPLNGEEAQRGAEAANPKREKESESDAEENPAKRTKR